MSMGSVILASCDCGFKTDKMYLGRGMNNSTKPLRLPYCNSCKSTYEVDVNNDAICTNCASIDTVDLFAIVNAMKKDKYMNNSHLICNFPNYCKNCNTLFEANMYDDDIVCSNCKSNNTVAYNNEYVVKNLDKVSFDWLAPDGVNTLKLSEKGSLCPQCNQFSLEFKSVGLWD